MKKPWLTHTLLIHTKLNNNKFLIRLGDDLHGNCSVGPVATEEHGAEHHPQDLHHLPARRASGITGEKIERKVLKGIVSRDGG
jgi:hypothetical protein